MRIGIDILGGDFAPEANLDGVFMALSELPNDVAVSYTHLTLPTKA